MNGIATTCMSVSELKAQRLRLPSLRELGRGGDPGVESGDQGRSDARGAGRRAPGIIILAGGDKRRGRRAVHPAPVRLSARSKLSRECEAMTMSR